MCLDINCIRDIIIYCVENIDYKEIPVNSWKVISVSLDKLYNSEKLSKYEKKDIMYSVMKLAEYKYITLSNITPSNKPYIDSCSITDVTVLGHNFYNSVKDNKIWNKASKVLTKIGNHTLKFAEDTSQLIASTAVKQTIASIVMSKL